MYGDVRVRIDVLKNLPSSESMLSTGFSSPRNDSGTSWSIRPLTRPWSRPLRKFHLAEMRPTLRGARRLRFTSNSLAGCSLVRIIEEELIAVGIIDYQEPVSPRTLLDRNALGFEFRAQRVQRSGRVPRASRARRSRK